MQFCNRVIQYTYIHILIFANAFVYAIEVFTAVVFLNNKNEIQNRKTKSFSLLFLFCCCHCRCRCLIFIWPGTHSRYFSAFWNCSLCCCFNWNISQMKLNDSQKIMSCCCAWCIEFFRMCPKVFALNLWVCSIKFVFNVNVQVHELSEIRTISHQNVFKESLVFFYAFLSLNWALSISVFIIFDSEIPMKIEMSEKETRIEAINTTRRKE